MRRLLLATVGALVLVLGTASLLGWQAYRQFLAAPLALPADGTTLLVAPGHTLRTVVGELEQQGATRFDWRWRLLLRSGPDLIRAGEFRLEANSTPPQLLALLASGRTVQHRFTIVEGWSYRQLREALLAEPLLLGEPASLKPETVMAALGSAATHPEGWFLPETYLFERGANALELLRRAHADMQSALADAWAGRAAELTLKEPYELLILASLVEKETGLAQERKAIAGVFHRRLQQGWRLETDPTVIYGLGETFDGNLRRVDLETDTPWNTYTRHGLPPTPIAAPGRAALDAAAQPASGTAMFFVADGTGGHRFSDTLEEHNRAVQELVRRQRSGQ